MLNEFSVFPPDLLNLISGYTCKKGTIGCTEARVFCYESKEETLYLKISEVCEETRRARDLMRYLEGKLPVPQIRYYREENGNAFLLMTQAVGTMACDCPENLVHEPMEQTILALANGLLMLQAIDISACPIQNELEKKLQSAKYNIAHNLVDMQRYESHGFESPTALFRWLTENRPPEDLCMTHGDYCLPNILIEGSNVTGFIDLGRGGIADKWQDIALCVRSLKFNLPREKHQEAVDMLFAQLHIPPCESKIQYYILLDEFF
jgi:kanamycin kinase/aminoglycoside 3'-phosphotransferase-3